jgi:predicted phage-related endonuclease
MATKKNYTKEIFKTREDWLENRGIGGSDAAAICNKSKWKDACDVYNALVHPKPKAEVKNARMVEGTLAEPLIRQLFELEHPEYKVIHPPKKGSWMFRRKDYPLLTVTPDGLLEEKLTGDRYGLEIKDIELRKREQKEMWLNNTLPDEYFFQALHYLVVMNDLKGVLLVARLKYYAFDYNNEYTLDHVETRYFWITIDDEGIAKSIEYLEKKEIAFILYNIGKKKRPPRQIEF